MHFIRHLPQLTAEELDEMKSLNPKTKKELEAEAAFDRFLEGTGEEPQPASDHHH